MNKNFKNLHFAFKNLGYDFLNRMKMTWTAIYITSRGNLWQHVAINLINLMYAIFRCGSSIFVSLLFIFVKRKFIRLRKICFLKCSSFTWYTNIWLTNLYIIFRTRIVNKFFLRCDYNDMNDPPCSILSTKYNLV